jgi:hypothetical protein
MFNANMEPADTEAIGGQRSLVGCEGIAGQGPFMLMILKVSDDNRINDARFQTYGCPQVARRRGQIGNSRRDRWRRAAATGPGALSEVGGECASEGHSQLSGHVEIAC